MTGDSQIKWFDFHCHVDLDKDPAAFIKHCERQRIVVFAVTTTPRAWPQNRIWMKDNHYVYAAVGLHPELVTDRYSEIELLENYISESRLVGEVGLDGSQKYRGSFDQQKDVFKRVLVASQRHGGRVVSIHSRRAVNDTLLLIKQFSHPSAVLCILHWFSGSLSEAKHALELGCYFSVNTAMLGSDRGQELIRNIPKDRLLTETDFPFIQNGSRDVNFIELHRTIESLAVLYKEKSEKIMEYIRGNAVRVFQFAGINLY